MKIPYCLTQDYADKMMKHRKIFAAVTKITKGIVVIGIISLMIFTFAACGNGNSAISGNTDAQKNDSGQNNTGKDNNTKFSPKDAIKIEEIDWGVTQGIMDGERFISFNYTNNSKYTILDVEMTFVQKEGITPEQLSVFDELKEDWEMTDEEVEEIYILGYNRKCAKPGETVTDSPCVINEDYELVENMEQYELMEPDMVSIVFIGDDGKGYAIYYDFRTQTYGESSEGGQDLQQWSDSEISRLLPKAEFRVVIVDYDEEDSFWFDAYGVSREEYDAYVEAVKSKGFTEDEYEDAKSYWASNVNGIEVDISYNAVEEHLSCSIDRDIFTEESDISSNDKEETVDTEITTESDTVSSGISPEFKEAMDSYEAFFDEYIAFMEKYSNSDDTISLMEDYLSYMSQYTETMKKLNEIDKSKLSTEEALYYSEVMLRISQKLADATY